MLLVLNYTTGTSCWAGISLHFSQTTLHARHDAEIIHKISGQARQTTRGEINNSALKTDDFMRTEQDGWYVLSIL